MFSLAGEEKVYTKGISKIIIDGYSVIQERIGDFNDIDIKKIPTILITDLSEVGSFEKRKKFPKSKCIF